MEVILIAAVTADGFIARHSHETIDWSEDLNVFKKQTMGFPVIVGSNTFKNMPNSLVGRKTIVVHRNDVPDQIISKLKSAKCFIAGGGITNTRFAPFLTHLYLTFHPYIFGKGVPLFVGLKSEFKLSLELTIPIKNGITQFQYRIIH
ncbi:MAG: dihydrofolate reductase family protein [Fidelibacterota bacterium]